VLYLVRHCSTTGQEPDAPLTAEGLIQADALAERLGTQQPTRIVSSPYRRAVDSIRPLAERLALPLEIDERLRERVLGATPTPDWRASLRASYDDPDVCFPGGESSRAALERALAAIADATPVAGSTVVVTHGNLLSLLLSHLDARDGFETWHALTNPDIYRVADGTVERLG
jgi:2,3-bisphosphoglycerate-dependent phosphoglycerate mutase